MTTGTAQSAGQAADIPAGSWDRVRADDSIQYGPVEMPERPEPTTPPWLEDILRWLGELLSPLGESLGLSWPVLKWVLLGLTALGMLWLLWRLIAPVFERPAKATADGDQWAPDHQAALALLEEADRLAAEGRFDEATHLLLKRSVVQIAAARPDWVEPSSTARELAALPALPEPARATFRVIAERVERSLFALRQLGQEDWKAARTAYAEFALQKLPGQGQ
ncbi:MAG: hypothetical protein ACK4GD_09695 [Sphingomonadaceae bacterium]